VDSNAHSDAWGSTSTNPQGGRVKELLFQQGLCILNEGNSPTFETAGAATCINITVATPTLASLINNWKVQPEMHLSDHHLITATIQLTPDQMPLRHGRNLKKADWKEFADLMNNAFQAYKNPILWTPKTIDNATASLHRSITEALDKVSEIKPYRPKKAIFSWYNNNLKALQTKCRKAHKIARRTPCIEEDWTTYQKLRKEYKCACLKARTASWKKFTSDQVSPKQAARLNQILRRQAYNKLGLLTKEDGTLMECPQESYQLLMKEHFPGSLPVPKIDLSKENVADPLGLTGRFNEPVLVDARPWINLTMLDLAFRQFGKHKCLGPDGFCPLVLCHLPEKARKALIDIYNAVIELQYTPLLWRGSDIVFLPKPGKQDYTDKRAFRPISLMPFLFKALERLIKWYMESHCSDFHPNQHALHRKRPLKDGIHN
jgi:hypothetical protein